MFPWFFLEESIYGIAGSGRKRPPWFDDDSQPDAAEGESVFWICSTGQPFLDDDFVRADLSAFTAPAVAPKAF